MLESDDTLGREGEQPQFEAHTGERWRAARPLSSSALRAWTAWCEHQDDILLGVALEDASDDMAA